MFAFLTITSVGFLVTIQFVYSSSSFVNQEYVDPVNDWKPIPSPTNYFKVLNKDGNPVLFNAETNIDKCNASGYPDIKGVTFSSDGKMLFATLWVNPVLVDQNKWITGGYQMLIDIPSVYDNGTDYMYRIEWDIPNATWIQTLEELTLNKEGMNRIHNRTGSQGIVENDRKYVSFSLDLNKISLPVRFKALFTAWGSLVNDEGNLCTTTDTTGFVDIPPPQFNLSISDPPTIFRKGETIIIPVEIASESGINSQVKLKAAYNNETIMLNMIPQELNIPPYSTAVSMLEIKALDNKYPAIVIVNATASSISSTLFPSGFALTTPSVNNITDEIRFTMGILPELGLIDVVNNYLGTWGAAASQTFGLIAGLGTAVTAIVYISSRRRHTEEQKENNP
jgi:hypothetical protein